MTPEARPFLRRVSGSFAVQVAGVGLAALAHLLLARVLGADAYGRFGTALGWATILAGLVTLGFDTSLLRFLPEYAASGDHARCRGVLRGARRVVLLAGLIGSACVLLAANLLEERIGPEMSRTLWITAWAIPLYALATVLQASMQGLFRVIRGQVPLYVVRPTLLLGFALMAVALQWRPSAADAMWAHLGTLVVTLAVLAALLRSSTPKKIATAAAVSEMRTWLRVSAPLFLLSGMRVLLAQVDIVVVAALVGTRAAGLYAAASRLARLTTLGLSAANAIVSPSIAQHAARSERAELQRLVGMSARVSTWTSLLIGIGLLSVGPWLLGLFGEAFRDAYPVLALLVVGYVVNSLAGPVGPVLNLTGHQGANARILGVITVLNVLLNVPAVLLLGMPGAALVTGLLLAVKNLWCWRVVRDRLEIDSSILGGRSVRGSR